MFKKFLSCAYRSASATMHSIKRIYPMIQSLSRKRLPKTSCNHVWSIGMSDSHTRVTKTTLAEELTITSWSADECTFSPGSVSRSGTSSGPPGILEANAEATRANGMVD